MPDYTKCQCPWSRVKEFGRHLEGCEKVKELRSCAYCGKKTTISGKAVKVVECACRECSGGHDACKLCRKMFAVATGEFPDYVVKLSHCPKEKASPAGEGTARAM
jgi:hypothetical protein